MIYIACPAFCYKIFKVIIEGLSQHLNNLGYDNQMVFEDKSHELKGEIVILFGMEHFHDMDTILLNNLVIIYNLEQLISGKWDNSIDIFQKAYCVWDYSKLNIEYMTKRNPNIKVQYVPIGYSPYFGEPQSILENVDRIGFIGNLSDRRMNILDRMGDFIDIQVYNHHYNEQLDHVIDTNNTFLNIHFDASYGILEVVRIIPLLCRGKNVISERSLDKDLDDMLSGIVHFVEDMEACSAESIISLSKQYPSQQVWEEFKQTWNWEKFIEEACAKIEFKDIPHHGKVAMATLHCNNRMAIFEVIDRVAASLTDKTFFDWIVLSQGCSQKHNEEIRNKMDSYGFRHNVLVIPENVGWSKGMNALYHHLYITSRYDFIFHLEDDWLFEDTIHKPNWLSDSCMYLQLNKHVSTMFFRKYVSDEDKYYYGWTRNIPYMCFKHSNSFNYESKIKTQPKMYFRDFMLRRIPEFLYSANPTLFRLQDYINKGVVPFPEFQDVSMKQEEWQTTTMDDAPQWGFSEGLSMEKIRDLVCINVDRGYFYHRN